jgi:hypothetical protein
MKNKIKWEYENSAKDIKDVLKFMEKDCDVLEILVKAHQVEIYGFATTRMLLTKFTIRDVDFEIDSPYMIGIICENLKKAINKSAGTTLELQISKKKIKVINTETSLRTTNESIIPTKNIVEPDFTEFKEYDYEIVDNLDLSASFITSRRCLYDAFWQLGIHDPEKIKIIADKKKGIILQEFGEIGRTIVQIPKSELIEYEMDFEGNRIKNEYSLSRIHSFIKGLKNLTEIDEPYCRVKFGKDDIIGLKIESDNLNATIETISQPYGDQDTKNLLEYLNN